MPIREAAVKDRDGRINTGQRHNDIFHEMPPAMIKDSEEGFLTFDGIFVTREEAARIAFECGQISEPVPKLFSEHLY